MNIIVHIIILTIFVYVLLIIDLPNNQKNPIITKMYLFFGMFLFELIIGLLVGLFRSLKISFREFLRQGALISALVVIAYGIYQDLERIGSGLTSNDKYVRALIITMISTFMIIVIHIIDMFFTKINPNLSSGESFIKSLI